MKLVKTYFLLADEKEARILENDGAGKGIFQVSRMTIDDMEVAPSDFSDQPGSGHGGVGEGRHGISSETSPRDNARSMFANYLIEAIVASDRKKEFDRLIVCAAPQLLGELRAGFEGKVEIYSDLDKNLVNTATSELPEHLSKIVAI